MNSAAFLRPRALSLLVLLATLTGCAAMFDDSGPGKSNSKLRPEDYSYNAKQYFHEGHYAQAKDQWQRQLEQEPDNWKARLGVAYCDVYLAVHNRLRRRDVEGARKQLQGAEAELRELLGDAPLEGKTTGAEATAVEPWKAGMGIGLALLAQAEVDQLDWRMKEHRRNGLALESSDRAKLVSEMQELDKRRRMHLSSSREIFERLSAMEGASPEAIKQAGQANYSLGDDKRAEKYYLRYLALAESSHKQHLEQKERFPELFPTTQARVQAEGMMQEKLDSNLSKRFEVLTRLARISWENKRFEASLDYLIRAHELRPDRLDLFVKQAQCQGELQRYDEAIDNLDKFIRESARNGVRISEDLAQAGKLKRNYEALLRTGQR